MNIELTIEQIRALEALHSKCRDRGGCDRIRCLLLPTQGWSTAIIAQSQLIHETTVFRHIVDYLGDGKLTPKNGGSQEHLSSEQNAELKQYLTDNTLITKTSTVAHIKERYNVCYSIPSMNKWLHRNGFSYKKPTGGPHKFDAEK